MQEEIVHLDGFLRIFLEATGITFDDVALVYELLLGEACKSIPTVDFKID